MRMSDLPGVTFCPTRPLAGRGRGFGGRKREPFNSLGGGADGARWKAAPDPEGWSALSPVIWPNVLDLGVSGRLPGSSRRARSMLALATLPFRRRSGLFPEPGGNECPAWNLWSVLSRRSVGA